ncbi:putative secreted protein [Wickerhamomyces ciferrii]|uniref:SUN-like protein 1 n=1 Tax=Wickerhamomyces ciferrii (strain ATCC 14091 / BCRC 22168 / CBS 111 / JCM 3599 / NBRC 0793 / NRRL Y-1031 F-60-10) TaxID=1206466 RepID=K0KPG3_WICCF|nr:uncharacterized protein BN7_4430 [Wickerhamomyces ciferrii]CCH44861.1 putative secreted protein [Wickerhamomyces ciferrii]
MLNNSIKFWFWLLIFQFSIGVISTENINNDTSTTSITSKQFQIPLTSQSSKSKVPKDETFQPRTNDIITDTDVQEDQATKSIHIEYEISVSTNSLQSLSSKEISYSSSESIISPISEPIISSSSEVESNFILSSLISSETLLTSSTSEELSKPTLLSTNVSIPINLETNESIETNETNQSIESNDSNASWSDTTNNSIEFQEENSDRFLSFEEWKKKKGVDSNNQNELKPELIPNRDSKLIPKDSIGEEMEIDISNFFNSENPESTQQEEIPEPEGKLYKSKFNFASFDCAATIVKTNSEAKSATSILFENKESYLLNPCSAQNKFVVIELCQDILVDSIVIGNFEFFSSTFKKIQISVSETFPVSSQSGWKILGQFDAKDIRDFQTFNISNPMIWAKYFRLEILDHYGSEFYCPLSIVRVHGRTMMQEYKQEEALQKSKVEQSKQEVIQKKQDIDIVDSLDSNNITNQDCILTNQTVNRSIKDIQSNLTNLTQYELSYDCPVSLPQLSFDSLFNNTQNDSKCDPIDNSNKTVSSTTQTQTHHQQQPTTGTQESIYKNIMKRLSLLESNATLSVLYIEEQSKLLSTAFGNLEKRQSLKFENLIDSFNSSIYLQLENLSKLYKSFQTETDDLLTLQRLKHESMLSYANHKIDSLSSDLKFQKIISFINMLILFLVLIYVILTRDTYIEDQPSSPYRNTPQHQHQQPEDWVQISKKRITSTGSLLKANLKRIYSTNGEVHSPKNHGTSDEEYENDSTTSTTTSNERGKINGKEGKKPLTPDNSDDEE